MEKLPRWAPAALGLCVFALYAPSFFNGLTNWEDEQLLRSGVLATSGWRGIVEALRGPVDGVYSPLSTALLLLIRLAFDGAPWSFHCFSALFFALGVASLPKALEVVGVSRGTAFLAAVLWAVHPFRVESVSWAACLSDPLSFALAVGAVRLYGAERRVLSAFVFAAALLSHPGTAPLALVFVVLEVRRLGLKASALTSLVWALPALALGVGAVALHQQSHGAALLRTVPNALTPVVTPLWYVQRLLWPAGLRAVYDFALPDVTVGLISVLVLGGIAVGLFATRRHPPARALAWGVGFFLVTLAPFAGFVTTSPLVAERFVFWPSLALAVGIAAGVLRLSGAPRVLVALGLIIACGVATVRRERDWKDSLTLWEANLALEPSLFIVHFNYAGALGGVGRFAEAYTHLATARRLLPRWPNLDCTMAAARAGQENVDGAWALGELQELCHAKAEVKWAAAKKYFAARDPRARIIVEELDMGERRADAAAAAGAYSLEKGDAEQALVLVELARQWQPSLEGPVVTQALALLQLGRIDEVLTVTKSPLNDPRMSARIMGVRAAALFKKGRVDEAQGLLEESVARLRQLGETVPVP